MQLSRRSDRTPTAVSEIDVVRVWLSVKFGLLAGHLKTAQSLLASFEHGRR